MREKRKEKVYEKTRYIIYFFGMRKGLIQVGIQIQDNYEQHIHKSQLDKET
ncbi:uncharacterized protein MELLADRAFT_71053 [Melampsora larici-populina 98AG31]|uniref:Uncharacterized protein n=1 Tax=Melampsora larici-populina (strain 98AG31 / pathotype 3-4-7) TaxID=747676 RepID=F4RB57_MELLP|nr:uncharacterized protein MELLADRAFT_71053 [Melampsora larici-populina 98AG31]EGG10107.1 hypothetical protein MELLADRAFT_71053 [Melampsora larici-populina 98AG31]